MKWTEIEGGAQRAFAVIFETGDEAVAGLTAFAGEHGLGASRITAIGAFSDAVLGFFDWQAKEYRRIPGKEQVEVVSLVGDFALGKADKPTLHAHAVLGRHDGTTLGGHLIEARVRPTLEALVTESPAHLHRRLDEETGLALIRL